MSFTARLTLFVLLALPACAPLELEPPRREPEPAPKSGAASRRSAVAGPRRVEARRRVTGPWTRDRVSLDLERVPLTDVLRELARLAGKDIVVVEAGEARPALSLQVDDVSVRQLIECLESLFPVAIRDQGGVLRVEPRAGPELDVLIYPLPGGIVAAHPSPGFESLRELSFIAREDTRGTTPVRTAEDDGASHVERLLARAPELVPWPEGCSWFLDRRQNLLFVRAPADSLDALSLLLDVVTAPTPTVSIEARFLELSEEAAREFGVEHGLTGIFPFDRDGLGRTQSGLGAETQVDFGSPVPAPGQGSGLRLQVLGILTEPGFESLLRALESEGTGEILSAPSVAAVNNTRSTIAITRNLPFVEDYRPVVDDRVVSGDGITETEAEVALVASINDENFTGIVLDVTPSVGADADRIHLRIEPVVREQVDSIVISSGAVVAGVPVPAITRPIIETRIIDTQVELPSGATVIMGGLKRTVTRRESRRVPWLGRIPWLGALFRYEREIRERRDLFILVTARLLTTVR